MGQIGEYRRRQRCPRCRGLLDEGTDCQPGRVAELSPAEGRTTVSHHSCSPRAMAASATEITDQPTMLSSHEFAYLAVPNPDAAKAPHAQTPGHDFTKQRKAAIQP